ncbi:hypothetical protein ACLOJK_018555, partial [Asimina triloba]
MAAPLDLGMEAAEFACRRWPQSRLLIVVVLARPDLPIGSSPEVRRTRQPWPPSIEDDG